ncbi:hypothetical protein IMSAGC003_03652 [Lachnospiraceae bacterium]|nr:hypothetical protein IMSAGC003_03652 [Lachnospiraceae bacterium]
MFNGNMVTGAIPARVFALYKIVASKKDISRGALRGLMEPEEIHEGTSYFSEILKAAMELKLVDQRDSSIIPIVPKEQLKTMEDFRILAIRNLSNWGDFENSQFYKCTNAIVNMDEKVYKHSNISDSEMLNYLSEQTGQQITPPMVRGWRFWAQFLGFGYISDMAFLPNAYIFVKNVMYIMGLDKNAEYPMREFMSRFSQYGKIIMQDSAASKDLNIALSSALRELHDNKEIELKYGSDQEHRWILYPSNESFNESVASIVYRG